MGFRFRIRNTLVFALLALMVVPLVGIAWYSYNKALLREFSEVKDRHLLLARNLSSALSRYETDVRASVRFIAHSLQNGTVDQRSLASLKALNIHYVTIADPVTGVIKQSITDPVQTRRMIIGIKDLEIANSLKNEGVLKFLPVEKSPVGNAIHVIGKLNGNVVFAHLNTKYFVELGGQISFGVKGHAAIVDQEGNVLSHPLHSWVEAAKNISSVSAVRRMMNGDTGIEQFYSPALKGDMIAGLTSVEGPGWGVMIPQPVSELHAKVVENLIPQFFGLILAMVGALTMVIVSMRWLAGPLENFSQHLRNQSRSGTPDIVPPSRCKTGVFELQNIFDAYNELVRTVQGNARELAEQVLKDRTTGIGNRAYFERSGKEQINRRIGMGHKGVLIFLDLDSFKEINDIRGHATGDAYLESFASSLYPITKMLMDREFRGVPGAHPIIGRIGGDEFAILLPIPDDLTDISGMCERLRKSFPKTIEVEGIEIPCKVSAGGAHYPEQGTCIQELIRKADCALYSAKSQGKDCFQLYSKINALGGKSEILPAVMQAIENDELILEYQPKFCLHNQRVTGVEALIRWDHPMHGKLPPNLFLPAIQQTYVMGILGEWVIGRAIRDLKTLDACGFELGFAINIGMEHFTAQGFESNLVKQCKDANVNPSRIQIEITEEVLDLPRDSLKKTVESIRNRGFSIAIDDYGRGFSNLNRLASVSVDIVKLDRSLVTEAVSNPRLYVILKSAIDMAHDLDSRVVVEGVETFEELNLVQKAGADAVQGFYFSKSLALELLMDWLEKWDTNAQKNQVQELQRKLISA